MHDGIGWLAAQLVDLRSGKRNMTTKTGRPCEPGDSNSTVQRAEALVLDQQVGIDSGNEWLSCGSHLCGLGVEFLRMFGKCYAHPLSLGLDLSDGILTGAEQFIKWLDLFHQFEDLILKR